MTPEAAAAVLVALGREELALVAADRWEELDDLAARRAVVLSALPTAAPAHQRPVLEEALAPQAAVTAELARARDAARGDLADRGRVRAGAAAYLAAAQRA